MHTISRTHPPPTEARRPRPVDARASHPRLAYLDNLKLLLVAVIIAGHGAVAYSSLESAWPYRTSTRSSSARRATS